MWSKVGVDLTIDGRETVVWNNIWSARSYDEILQSSIGGWGVAYNGSNFRGSGSTNGSYVGVDPVVEDAVAKMHKAVLQGRQAAQDPLHKELMKYVLDQAWAIGFPMPARTTCGGRTSGTTTGKQVLGDIATGAGRDMPG